MKRFLTPALAGLLAGMLCTLIPTLRAGCELGCGESKHWAYEIPSQKCVIWNGAQADEGSVTADLGEWTINDDQKTISYDLCPYGDCDQICTSVNNVPRESIGGGANQGCTAGGGVPLYECLFP